MDNAICAFGEKSDWDGLLEYLLKQPPKQISSLLRTKYANTINFDNCDFLPLLQYIFRVSEAQLSNGDDGYNDGKPGAKVIDHTFTMCIDLLCQYEDSGTSRTAAKNTQRLAELLCLEARQISKKALVDIIFRILTGFKSIGSLTEPLRLLIPVLLDILCSVSTVRMCKSMDSTSEQEAIDLEYVYSGQKLCAYWIDRALCYKWDPDGAAGILTMLREVSLSEKQKRSVIKRIASLLREIDLDQVPPLVHQLFLFLRKDDKLLALQSVISFFDNANETPEDSVVDITRKLGEIEGTVLLHFGYSAKQDQDLGHSLIKYMKEGPSGQSRQNIGAGGLAIAADRLSPFSLAFLLSIAQIRKFEDDVYSMLKSIITASISDRRRIAKTPWLRSCIAVSDTDTRAVLLKVATKSSFGWEQVILGVVRLSYLLIEHVSAPGTLRVIGPESAKEIVSIAIDTIHCAFGMHDFVRDNIIEYISSQIPFKLPSTEYFLELLATIFSKYPNECLDCTRKLKVVLDYLPLLPPTTSHQLIIALTPIIQRDASYRNTLLLILRKRLFSKTQEDSKAAMSSLLSLVEYFLRPTWNAQGTLSSTSLNRSAPGSKEGVGAALDILNMIRRCLSRQQETRIRAYEGLCSAIQSPAVQGHPTICASLHSMLQAELVSYRSRSGGSSNGNEPPILLHDCINPNTNKTLLPLPCLLQCLALSSASCAQRPGELATVGGTDVDNVLNDIVGWMASLDFADLDLDASSSFSLGDPDGVRNRTMASLFLGCCDVAMEYIIAIASSSGRESSPISYLSIIGPRLPDLYEKRHRLIEILRPRATNELGRKSPVSPFSDSLVTIKTLSKALPWLLNLEGSPHPQNPVISGLWRSWRGNMGLCRYFLGLAQHQIQTKYDAKASQSPLTDEAVADVTAIAHSVYLHILFPLRIKGDGIDDVPSYLSSKTQKSKSMLHTACELLAQISQLVECKTQKFDDFIRGIAELTESEQGSPSSERTLEVAVAAEKFMSQLRQIADVMLSQHPPFIKEATQILIVAQKCYFRLQSAIELDSQQTHSVLPKHELSDSINLFLWWSLSYMTQASIDDLAITKQFAGAILAMSPYFDTELESSETPMTLEWLGNWEGAQMDKDSTLKLSTKNQFKPVRQIVNDLRCVLGDIDDYYAPPEDRQFDDPLISILALRNALPVTSLLISWLEDEASKLEWAISQFRICYGREILQSRDPDPEPIMTIKTERRISKYCLQLTQILGDLTRVIFKDTHAESLLRCHQKYYRVLFLFTKAKIWAKAMPVTDAYIELLSYVGMSLSPVLYDFLAMYQGHHASDDDEGASGEEDTKLGLGGMKSKTKLGKRKARSETISKQRQTRISRESRLVPGLVFTLEQFERFVIQLGKVSKVPLSHHLRRSTARDFRVDTEQLHKLDEMQNCAIDDPSEEDDRQSI